MAGGELKTVFRTEPGEFIMKASTLAWSKDGQSVLVTRCKPGPPQKCEVWRTPINGGAPERIIAADIIFEIRLSPDGKRLAYDASQFPERFGRCRTSSFRDEPATQETRWAVLVLNKFVARVGPKVAA